MAEPLSKEFLETLRCPITRSPLHQEGDELVSEVEGLRYPIRGGLPDLLPDEAKPPEGQTLEAIKSKYGV